MLQIINLAIGYNNTPLLANLSIDLPPKNAIAITGHSGCGKSTLLRTIATLIDPISGKILLDEQTPHQFTYPKYRRQVLYVDQKPILLDESVNKNLALPFTYNSARQPYQQDAAINLLKQLNLDPDIINQPARNLSVGQQQRICLVRALLLSPRVLLLDEPTSALDEENQIRVINLLNDHITNNNLSILIATHQNNNTQKLIHKTIDLMQFATESNSTHE